MSTIYNNIPSEANKNSATETAQFFNSYYQVPLELNGTTLTATKGFFETKGFSPEAAESVAIIILSQAKRDDINSFKILDTLKGFSDVQLSSIVGEILNYNRFKTSSLGITSDLVPADEIQRNIFL
jgi:hypothetical protein